MGRLSYPWRRGGLSVVAKAARLEDKAKSMLYRCELWILKDVKRGMEVFEM